VDAPLDRIPLFAKAGSIVPIGPDIQYTGQKPEGPLMILVYAGADGNLSLYEDDGTSNAYLHGAFSRIPMHYDNAGKTLTIGPREGKYPGMPEKRDFYVRIIKGTTPQAMDFDKAPYHAIGYTGGGSIVYHQMD
jgi:alpha-D-xyloside xylohydrolase